jgi:hydroxymethylglutaryl-CoA lyase
MEQHIKIVECPRDAMQGWDHFIPTKDKADYINQLLQAGFDTIDFGSFVSAKAIPQLKDTAEVLTRLNLSASNSCLLAIVANNRGAEEAVQHADISYLGYPFSVSETFQQRNANSTPFASIDTVSFVAERCRTHNKKLVVYISMAFGNPYGDAWSPAIVYDWVEKLMSFQPDVISLADTVGIATADQVFSVTEYLVKAMPGQEIGVHLHSAPGNRVAKLQAALDAGCRRFDGAMKGIGGCPMAGDALVGNLDTEWMVDYLESKGFRTGVDRPQLKKSGDMATKIFIA